MQMQRTSRLVVLQLVAAALAVALAAAAAAPSTTDDGTAVPSCAAKLVPCGAYLNSTSTPPASCCGPLKDAAFNETRCLCAMLLNKQALQAFGVAPDQGMALAKSCGVTADASVCAKYNNDDAGALGGGTTAGSSTSTGGSPASTVTKPTANGGTTLRQSFTSLAGFSFIWCLWTITMS